MLENLRPIVVEIFTQNFGTIHTLYLIYWNVLASFAFGATLLFAYFLSRKISHSRFESVSNFLAESVFKAQTEYEINKIALLRIIFGTVILVRQFFVFQYMTADEKMPF